MANLTFTKSGGRWTARQVVSKPYNLHIEDAGNMVSVYQNTAYQTQGTNPCIVRESSFTGDRYDNDFPGEIFPKEVTVVCDKQPSVAIITEKE